MCLTQETFVNRISKEVEQSEKEKPVRLCLYGEDGMKIVRMIAEKLKLRYTMRHTNKFNKENYLKKLCGKYGSKQILVIKGHHIRTNKIDEFDEQLQTIIRHAKYWKLIVLLCDENPFKFFKFKEERLKEWKFNHELRIFNTNDMVTYTPIEIQ